MNPLSLALPVVTRWSLFGVGLLAPLAVGVLLRTLFAPEVARRETPVVAEAARPCDATRLGDSECPLQRHCVAGRCEPLRFPARAGVGAACAGELCAPGLECFVDVCTAPDDLPLAPPLCRSAGVRAAIDALRRKCEGQQGDARMSLDRCEVAAWKSISTNDPTFVEQLGRLPGLFTVHFPADRPDAAGRWATPKLRADYRSQLSVHLPVLRTARQILVVGRASVDGGSERNRELAERRSELVASLLTELLGSAGPPIRRWSLASEYGLAPERFKLDVRETPVTWSSEQTGWLTGALASDLKLLPPSEWQGLLHVINRVVLVVPLYCDGTEFHPAPAFQGFEEVLQ